MFSCAEDKPPFDMQTHLAGHDSAVGVPVPGGDDSNSAKFGNCNHAKSIPIAKTSVTGGRPVIFSTPQCAAREDGFDGGDGVELERPGRH